MGQWQTQMYNQQKELTWLDFEVLETKHHTSLSLDPVSA